MHAKLRTGSVGLPPEDVNEQFSAQAGEHLIFNALWTIQHFCVHQMLMCDPMHQVDLEASVHLIRAILCRFRECVETALVTPGLAASKLQERLEANLELMLAKRRTYCGQK